jgi:hypothetical protein
MMEANSMSLSKPFFAIFGWAIACSVCAAPAHRFECPSTLSDGPKHYALDNASLFDGPPEQMADLIPVSGKTADRWDLTGVDPYLVCRYQGTDKVVTIHAQGAKVCEAKSKPFTAYCVDP